MLNSRPGIYKLNLLKRKGFVKLALETGASIVPVFSFNEVELYHHLPNEPGSKIRRFQEFLIKHTGFTLTILLGKSFFGLIPYPTEIVTVIGAPIKVLRNPTPSKEEVDELHGKFVDSLIELFERHKFECN
jgi:2-acylglycerol O-acyltransferase 2